MPTATDDADSPRQENLVEYHMSSTMFLGRLEIKTDRNKWVIDQIWWDARKQEAVIRLKENV